MRPEVLALFPPDVVGAETFDLGGAAEEPLWPEEERLVARAVPKRRKEFAAGRACARRALAQLGLPPRPLLAQARVPRWPDGVLGSITHTEGYAAAVVAPRAALRGLGIDAERRERVSSRLWRQIAAGPELDWLQAEPAEGALRGALLFSAKEAFYKAQYCVSEQWVGFHDAAFRCDEAGQFEIEVHIDLARLAPAGARFSGRYLVTDRHVITALAIPHPR